AWLDLISNGTSIASTPFTIADRSIHPAGGRPLISSRYVPAGIPDIAKCPSGFRSYFGPPNGKGRTIGMMDEAGGGVPAPLNPTWPESVPPVTRATDVVTS